VSQISASERHMRGLDFRGQKKKERKKNKEEEQEGTYST
jgi:hypothetical protein